MSSDGDDDDYDEQDSQNNDTGSFKIQKPSSIDRYFGKFDSYIKFLYLSGKFKLNGSKDAKLDIKTQKSKMSSPLLSNYRVNLTIKDGRNKFAFGFKPYCLVPVQYGGLYDRLYLYKEDYTDLDASFTTSIPTYRSAQYLEYEPTVFLQSVHKALSSTKFQAKIKDKGQMSLKISRTVDIIENSLKIHMDHNSQWTKYQTMQYKYNCQLTYKALSYRYQLNDKYYIKGEQKCGVKFGTQKNSEVFDAKKLFLDNNNNQLKIEGGLQICSEQLKGGYFSSKTATEDSQGTQKQNQKSYSNQQQSERTSYSKKIKPLYHIKLYNSHKISKSRFQSKLRCNNHFQYLLNNYCVRSIFSASQNIYNSTVKLDTSISNKILQNWGLKYLVNGGKWKFGCQFFKKYGKSQSSSSDSSNQTQDTSSLQFILEKESIFLKKGLYTNIGVYCGNRQSGLRIWGKLSKTSKYQLLFQQKYSSNNSSSKYSKPNKSTSPFENINFGIKFSYNG